MKLSKKSVFSKNSYTSTIQSKNYKEKNKKIGGLKWKKKEYYLQTI